MPVSSICEEKSGLRILFGMWVLYEVELRGDEACLGVPGDIEGRSTTNGIGPWPGRRIWQ